MNLTTDRLLIRDWRDEDLAPFANLNADPEVMRYFPATLSRRESDTMVVRIRERTERIGYCFWAVEERDGGAFVGMVGLNRPDFEAPFMPCVEIGWRLARRFWGRGYATEAARACLQHGFQGLDLGEILAFTVPENAASRRVMEKIGMVRDEAGDFAHPRVEDGHPLQAHVLYRIRRARGLSPTPGHG